MFCRLILIVIGAAAIFGGAYEAEACFLMPPEDKMARATVVVDGSAVIKNRIGTVKVRRIIRGKSNKSIVVGFEINCIGSLSQQQLDKVNRKDAIEKFLVGRFYLRPNSPAPTYNVLHFEPERSGNKN